ncbi:hypothetical protein JCM12107_20140 [Corynebacterium simulans]
MHVVAASMHVAVAGGVCNCRFLLHGQPVEVSAEKSGGARAVAEDGHSSEAADGLDNLAVESAQALKDSTGGALFFVGELRVSVKVLVEFALPAKVYAAVFQEVCDFGGICHS